MAFISCVLIDNQTRILAPAVIDLQNFDIKRVSSTIDVIDDFKPNLVGIYTEDYKSPFRTYELKVEDKNYTVKNTVAKNAILKWSKAMSKEGAQKVLEIDEILKAKNYLDEAVATNQESKRAKIKI